MFLLSEAFTFDVRKLRDWHRKISNQNYNCQLSGDTNLELIDLGLQLLKVMDCDDPLAIYRYDFKVHLQFSYNYQNKDYFYQLGRPNYSCAFNIVCHILIYFIFDTIVVFPFYFRLLVERNKRKDNSMVKLKSSLERMTIMKNTTMG